MKPTMNVADTFAHFHTMKRHKIIFNVINHTFIIFLLKFLFIKKNVLMLMKMKIQSIQVQSHLKSIILFLCLLILYVI